VDCYDVGGRLADHASGDVLADGGLLHGHHRDGGARRQPVGLVVPAGVVADVVEVAEDERHRRELSDARSCKAEVLAVGFFVPLDVEEGVAVPELDVSAFASGDLHALTVLDQEGAGEVVSGWFARSPRFSLETGLAYWTRRAN
jgi:hypothetical protein